VFSAEPPRIDLGEFVVPQNEADAYLNMGDGDYPQAATLTSGSARPWYESQVVSRVFGGTPDSVERAAFTQTVVDRVQATYEKSGIALSLTADPAVSAAHTLSVVSGAQSPMNPDAIGVSDMGRNGFGFIDKLDYAQSVDELAWAVARNVSHELMHTFGTVHHDQTGSYLDAAVTPWELLVDPETTFSSEAVADLLAKDFRTTGAGGTGLFTAALMVDHSKSCDCGSCTGLSVSPIPVPELGALFIWSLGGLAVMETQRRRRSHRG
jgi:hypothetical protein